jgi:hypothetical protein
MKPPSATPDDRVGPKPVGVADGMAVKDARRAAALRANLSRRKAQARARADSAVDGPDACAPDAAGGGGEADG